MDLTKDQTALLRALLRYVSLIDRRLPAVLAVAILKVLAERGIVTLGEVMCSMVEFEAELPWRRRWIWRWIDAFRLWRLKRRLRKIDHGP